MTTNIEAAKIIADANLDHKQVAQYLNVSIDVVQRWFPQNDNDETELMPESELHFLKYCLMTDNTRSHLF